VVLGLLVVTENALGGRVRHDDTMPDAQQGCAKLA
jgi:hypothetical protein